MRALKMNRDYVSVVPVKALTEAAIRTYRVRAFFRAEAKNDANPKALLPRADPATDSDLVIASRAKARLFQRSQVAGVRWEATGAILRPPASSILRRKLAAHMGKSIFRWCFTASYQLLRAIPTLSTKPDRSPIARVPGNWSVRGPPGPP